MFKLQFSNRVLVLSLLITMLGSPFAAATCAAHASCTKHQKASKTDEHCCDQADENHCPPETKAAHQDFDHHVQTDRTNNFDRAVQNGCCLRDAPQHTVLAKQNVEPTQHFHPVIPPAQFDFSPFCQKIAIVFCESNIVYPARSALSRLPARAPPVL